MAEMYNEQETVVTRNQLHKDVMVCMYQYLFYLQMEEKPDIRDIIESTLNQPLTECDPFVRQSFIQSVRHAQEAVDMVTPLLNQWKFERLGLIEQALLIIGYTYVKYMDFPKPIAINIVVKLAQKYSDAETYKYINAVLERI